MAHAGLIHWNQAETLERAERLERHGYRVTIYGRSTGTALLRELRADPPDVLVIDLRRLPMQGRDVAIQMRLSPRTRHMPIVFVDGLPDKRDRVREHIPDGIFATWDEIGVALAEAMSAPPVPVQVPKSAMHAFHNTPLLTKLGIRSGLNVALIDAPDGFEEVLGELPAGTALSRVVRRCDLALWFVTAQEELEMGIGTTAQIVGDGVLWIVWPKAAGRAARAVSHGTIRAAMFAHGFAESKVCSVNDMWSAVRYTRKSRTSVDGGA